MITAVLLADALGLARPTPEQIEVIQAPLSPALVVAGAGSGKTETMAARVVYLVATGQVRPDQVLGLTFTRKAATELGSRIRPRLRGLATLRSGGSGPVSPTGLEAVDGGEPTVVTYHAFGGQLISEFGPLLGMEPAAGVLTPTASWQLARRVVSRWDGDLDTDLGPDQVTERLLALSGALSDHLTSSAALAGTLQELLDTVRSAEPGARQRKALHSKLEQPVKSLQDRLWILPLVDAFAEAKRAADVVDFADQMNLAARLVQGYPSLGRQVRERYRVVLLDEYQDTGHAQRILLRGLFGLDAEHPDDAVSTTAREGARRNAGGHAVTAVGDPVQSIYSWRGASAGNLVRFVDDFPDAGGRPAPVLSLLTSFRNPVGVLDLANRVSAPLRSGPIPVATLRPREGAGPGAVSIGLFPTVVDEDAWVAERIADRWRQAGWNPAQAAGSRIASPHPFGSPSHADGHAAGSAATGPAASDSAGVTGVTEGLPVPPTTAVLLRRRRDMPAMAEALRARGLPVEVVGLGGLLSEPEVADLVATLRVLVDPTAGPAAIRLLTGARWQVGMSDLDALARRARALAAGAAGAAGGPATAAASGGADVVREAIGRALPGEDIDAVSLVDAAADPGNPAEYTASGLARINRFAGELDRLRQRLGQPLVDLIADIERTTGLDVEAAVHGSAGRAHLDAIADVVGEVAANGAGAADLLDYFAAAQEREDGLRPGEASVAAGSVQILTVHAAKGLEWDTVAVPHLSTGVFPSARAETWLGDASQLPPSLRGDRAEIPDLLLPDGADQSGLAGALTDHVDDIRDFQLREERRLLYVALTRAEHTLLVSGHHWGASGMKPSGPSAFLTELREACAEEDCDCWAPAPDPTEANPLTERIPTAAWPPDPLGDRRSAVQDGADLVRRAMDRLSRARSAAAVHPPEEGIGVERSLDRAHPKHPSDAALPGSEGEGASPGTSGREGRGRRGPVDPGSDRSPVRRGLDHGTAAAPGVAAAHGTAAAHSAVAAHGTAAAPGVAEPVDPLLIGGRPGLPAGPADLPETLGVPRHIGPTDLHHPPEPPEEDWYVDHLAEPDEEADHPGPWTVPEDPESFERGDGPPPPSGRGPGPDGANHGAALSTTARPVDEPVPLRARLDDSAFVEPGLEEEAAPPDPYGWAADVDLLLAERAASARPAPVRVSLPGSVSVSTLVELADDPGRLARRLRRPLPAAPVARTARGSAFHQWVEYFYTGEALVDLADLPGAGGPEPPVDPALEALQQAFLSSPFAARAPVDIEVSFSTTIGGLGVRGRIDAVFADPDGGYTVVDWKTGRPPAGDRAASSAVQLASYRWAVAQLWSVPLDDVRAAFHYVADNLTIAPVDLLDAAGLAALVADRTAPGGGGPGTVWM